ncbi:retrovirus-related pol polyprotein from transposon TNT 1-94 [Tanacetum coccineum]
MGFNFSLVQEHLQPTNNIFELHHNTSRAISDKFSKNSIRRTGYDNQRAVNVAGARENVGTLVVQKSGIQIVKLEMIKYARFFGFNGYLFPMELLLSNGVLFIVAQTVPHHSSKTHPFQSNCIMAKATSSSSMVMHRRLSYLNFDTINLLSKNNIVNGLPKLKFVKDHLCSSCELGKAKRKYGKNLDKMKEKGDACIFVGYSTQSRAFRMASDHVSSDPVPQSPTTVLEQDSLSPGPQSQENVPQVAETVTTSNELDLLFSLMFDELLNGTTPVVSKSSAVHAVDAPNKHQQQHTTPSTSTTVVADTPPLNIQATPVMTSQAPSQVPTVTATEKIIQAETNNENA